LFVHKAFFVGKEGKNRFLVVAEDPQASKVII
jgi:hypothetical protein